MKISENEMDLFVEIASALRAEERVMLATILSTTGSTPASAHSKMLVTRGGIVSLGTVGGGCTEGDVLLHANRLLAEDRAEILTFHLNEDDPEHGLICGGSLDVLIEPLSKSRIGLFEELKTIRDEGDDALIATFLTTEGGVRSKTVVAAGKDLSMEQSRGAAEVLGWTDGAADRQGVKEGIIKAHRRYETLTIKLPGGVLILEPVPGAPGLLIFGGGHVSKYVSRMASMAGFRVTIVDDREKFANRERFPEASRTIALDLPEAFRQLTIKPSTYIVIVTRGHRHDEEVLGRVIGSKARYIGMIGSKKKVLTTFEHLIAGGVPPALLERVHSPIGIEIGAVTAEEIGISVTAELIAERRGVRAPFSGKSASMAELVERLK
jgi:xanthine dehydrogenase accessory factor